MKTKTSSIPLQTAFIYLFMAGSWIFFSDRILALFASDVTTLNVLQTYKGFFFVSFTAILLFLTLRTKLRMVERERIQRTQTESTLYENEAEYSLMIENSGEAILLTEQNGTIFSANPAACKMFGRSREEICTIGRAGIVDANDPRLQQALDERKRTGVLKGELNFIRSDGTIFPGEMSSNVFKDVHGNERTSIIIRDITERKRKEESLRKSEMRLRRAENIARFGNWEFSLTDKIMHASDGAKNIYGFMQNEMSLADVQRVPLPEYRSYLDNELKDLIEQNKQYDVEFKIRKADDGKIVDIHSKAEYDADNKTIFGVFHDITEQKRAEEALMLSESNLQSVINREESIWSLDKNYNLIICNEYFRTAYRAAYNIEISVGTNLINILSPELKAFWKPKYDAALSGQRISFEFQETIQSNNYYFEIFLNPITSNGFVTGVTALSVNITERKNAEDELRTKAKQMGALLKASQNLSTTLDMDSVFQATTDSIIELIDLQSAAIYMREGEMLYLGATSPSLPAQFPEELRRAPLKDHPHIYEAITTRQPVFLLDTAVVELTPAERIISEQRGLRSILYLPVIVEEKAIGVLIVAHIGEPRMLTASEIDMCRTLANLASIAVENSRLYESAQQEITERKNAELSLRVSEEKFRVLFESAKDGIMQFTIDGNIVAVNESFAKMHGYTVDELMKKNFIELDTPESRRLAPARMEKFKAGESMMFEVEHYHKNGQIIPLEVSGNRVIIGDQKYILGFHRDITERKKTEEALRQSEEKYRGLVENSPDAIAIYADGKVVFVNSECLRLMRATNKEELIGKSVIQFVHPDSRPLVIQRMKQSAIEGKPLPAEHEQFIRLDGTTVDVEVKALPMTYEHKPAVQLIVHDITERKQAEEALKESEKYLRETQIIAELGTYTLDIASGKWKSSEILDAIFGIDVDYEKSVEGWSSIIHPEWQQMMTDYFIQEIVGNKSRFNKEYKIIRKNDKIERWVHGIGELKFNVAGQPITMVGTIKDITERKQAEEALRQSEARFRNLLQDVNSVAVQGYSPDGTTQYWNKASERLYGFTAQEAIGRNLLDLIIPSEARVDVEKAMRQMAESGEPIPASELSLMRKDGTRVSVLSSHSIVQIPGRKQELFCIDIDLTERKQAEEALRQAQKMESIGTLAGGIAHDFNNLLNAVLGQSALAINKLPKESPAVSNITKAIQASERAADLTRQLLAYSGKGKFFTVEIDLNKLVSENVQMLEVSIPKTTQLRFELGSPSPRIIGDISQIQQVIMNLIINAGEAMGPNPGYITIRTSRIELPENNMEYSKYTATPIAAGSYAMLQVRDTGSGISQETLERIFDPFFTTKFTGRGLGLAAVLGIIKGHKGGLRIESEERKGTMFEIVWPFVEPSTISKVQEKKDTSALKGEGKTILIIDDDPFVFQLLEDVLGEVNFSVIGATDPLKGIELYRKDHQNISMIILDFSMPTMNGKDAFEKLLQINDKVKVLLCSGYPEEDTLSTFGKVRPTGFLQKPYKPETLVEWVSRHC